MSHTSFCHGRAAQAYGDNDRKGLIDTTIYLLVTQVSMAIITHLITPKYSQIDGPSLICYILLYATNHFVYLLLKQRLGSTVPSNHELSSDVPISPPHVRSSPPCPEGPPSKTRKEYPFLRREQSNVSICLHMTEKKVLLRFKIKNFHFSF